jgi:serine O-acetyltransferase
MFGLLLEIIVKWMGGIWGLRRKINARKPGIIRTIYLKLYYLVMKFRGGFIGHSVTLSGPLCLPHGIKGVFIAGGTRLGRNCVVFQNVTIGSNALPSSKKPGFPSIGDNCYIGAGATIIGGISIGDNCRIGANCTVFSDVKDNCVVVSPKPLVIAKDNLDNKYYRWSSDGPVYFNSGEWIPVEDEKLKRELRKCL